MKKVFPYLKNKFVITTLIVAAYTLFLDENDVFTMIAQNNKLNALEKKKEQVNTQLTETKITLEKLKYRNEVERFAREHKYFKKDNEDVFVIFYE